MIKATGEICVTAMDVADVVVLLASLPICVCLKGPIRKLIKEE